ncbi:MAG: helix-turn-helix transcriptional regulator [Bacteroidota bacterium]
MRNRLKEIRVREGISQQALAERVGVSRQSIHAIEKGKYVPSTELSLKICRQLEMAVEVVFFLD